MSGPYHDHRETRCRIGTHKQAKTSIPTAGHEPIVTRDWARQRNVLMTVPTRSNYACVFHRANSGMRQFILQHRKIFLIFSFAMRNVKTA
jgi:hypothetical protein